MMSRQEYGVMLVLLAMLAGLVGVAVSSGLFTGQSAFTQKTSNPATR